MEGRADNSLIRTWIYRSVKKLSPEIEADILRRGKEFSRAWLSHGEKLVSDFRVLHHHFLIFSVDQRISSASGCSIDSSVGFIREVEKTYNLGLLDRMQIGFMKDGEVVFHHFNDLEKLAAEGVIGKDDLVFNTLVENLREFDNSFLTPIYKSPFAGIFNTYSMPNG